MSTEYGFRCRTHTPALSSPSNLKEYVARSLLAKRSEIPVLMAWESDMLITFGAGNNVNYGVGEVVNWLSQHPDCDVVIEDEYGRIVDDDSAVAS